MLIAQAHSKLRFNQLRQEWKDIVFLQYRIALMLKFSDIVIRPS